MRSEKKLREFFFVLSVVFITLRSGSDSTAAKEAGEQDRAALQEAVEIRADTENRHRLDEYAYREDRRDDGTHVLGTIHNAVVWESDKSPYVMDENVFVAKDGSLVIEPGVEVKVERLTENTSSINAYIGLEIIGTLRAQGTPEAMIRFTSASDKPNKYREWQGIGFYRGSSMNMLKWVLVENAINGVNASSSALIAHCIFRECHTGIYLERDFVGDVLHNVSAFNAYSGIRCKGTRAEATIINNICYENGDGIRGWWDAVAFSDYNLYWSSKRNASAHYYSGMEAGAHDVTANPCFVNPHENDFRLAGHSPAKEIGYGNADIGLDIRHWSEEAGEQENANWIANGARSLWYQGLELERRDQLSGEEGYRQALKLSVAPELRDKIFCSLACVLISKAEYSFARQILHTVLSESEYRHIRDLARRNLAEAWALDGKPDEALQVVMAVEWPQSQVWAKPLTAKYKSITGNHEDALRSLADLKSSEPYRYVKALSNMVSDLLSDGQVDAAVHVMKGFDDCPLAEEVPVAYLKIAQAARDQQRPDLAADLLYKSCRLDPFSKKTPELLTLLAQILDRDMKRHEEANAVLVRLCVDYFPFNRYVMEAGKKIHVEMPSPDKMILLDASLGGSTIFDRGPTGGNNFGQYEVMRILTEAGYTVHTNDRRQSIGRIQNALMPDIINRYGLIILNGRYGGQADPPIPQEVIDTLVEYVGDGGSLLVVASGKRLGSGKVAQYYNPLVKRFGLHFIENVDLPRELVTATSHPAMNGLENCVHTFGVPVRVDNGDILGYVNEQPVIALTQHGRGKVVAAGLGSGFMGNTLGTRKGRRVERAQMNKELLVRLASYLLSSGKRKQDQLDVQVEGIENTPSAKAAGQYFNDAIKDDPNSYAAFWTNVKLARHYVKTSQELKAQELIDELFGVLDGDKTKAKGALILAEEYVYIYKKHQANRLFRYFIENDPNNPNAREALAQVAYTYLATEDYNDAEAAARQFIERYSDHNDTPGFVYTLASLFRRRGQLEKALSLLDFVLTNYPNDLKYEYAWMEKAAIGLDLSNNFIVEQVVCKFKAELPRKPAIAGPFRNLADQFALRRQSQKAQELYQYIIDHSTENEEVLQSRMGQAMLNIGRGDKSAAQVAFDALVADLNDQPERTQLLYALGIKCDKFKHLNYSEAAFRKILEVDPNCDAAVILERIGWTLYARRLYDQAIAEYRKIVDNYPQSKCAAGSQYWLAQSYYKKRDYEQARVEYQNVINKYPDDRYATYSRTKIATIQRIWK